MNIGEEVISRYISTLNEDLSRENKTDIPVWRKKQIAEILIDVVREAGLNETQESWKNLFKKFNIMPRPYSFFTPDHLNRINGDIGIDKVAACSLSFYDENERHKNSIIAFNDLTTDIGFMCSLIQYGHIILDHKDDESEGAESEAMYFTAQLFGILKIHMDCIAELHSQNQ